MTQKLGPLQQKIVDFWKATKEKQCSGVLHDGVGYCCLGLIERFVEGIEPVRRNGRYFFRDGNEYLSRESEEKYRFYDREAIIPLKLQEGFYAAIAEAGYTGKQQAYLTVYNDHGATFAQIAAAVEAVPAAVFGEEI